MLICIRNGGLLCLSIILMSCMARGPVFLESKATAAKPGHALVYIFRENAQPTLFGATIQIDGKEVVTLKQCGFTWVYAKPGKRKIEAVWDSITSQEISLVSLNISDGETYYVELTGISKYLGTSYGMDHSLVGSLLSTVDAEVAEARLAKCCKFQKPLYIVY